MAGMKTGQSPPGVLADKIQRPQSLRHDRWVLLGMPVILFLLSACSSLSESSQGSLGFPIVDHAGMGESLMLDIHRGMPVASFKLVDHHNHALDQSRLQGKWTILFFGYTHCPDFCPTTLSAINVAYRRLQRETPDAAKHLQVIFISVDPARDTPEVLADYITFFNPDFTAATGGADDLRRFTKFLDVTYNYADPETGNPLPDEPKPAGDYLVNHTANFYVIDDHGRLATWVAPPHTATRVSLIFNYIKEQIK